MGFFDWLSLDVWGFGAASWTMYALVIFVVGFSKTGVPGITIVTVPLMAMLLPPKISVGVMLPLLMSADVLSVFHYFRYARWRYCFPYLLFVGAGVFVASLIAERMSDANFGVLIGRLVLLLLVVSTATGWVKDRMRGTPRDDLPPVPKPPMADSVFFGFFAGLFSAMANAAGPVVSIYLLRSRLQKFEFLGTTAVCAFVMNWLKVPLFVRIGMITPETLKLDIAALPFLLAGGAAGIVIAKRIPQRAFKTLILILAFAASLKLALG